MASLQTFLNAAETRRVQFAALLALAFYAHSLLWWTEPRDMSLFLLPWYQHLVHYGPLGAFAHPFSNYEPPYLYFLALTSLSHGLVAPLYAIKLLSVAGTLFLLCAVADLLAAMGLERRAAVTLLIVPTVVLNAALLAQCDALWAGACVFAVAAMTRGRTVGSLLWCGVAIALKAQAAFIAPFIIGALIGRRVPLWQWMIPAAAFAGCMLPALLLGWPALDIAMTYAHQASTFHWPGRLANPWIVATIFAPETAKGLYGVGYALAVIGALAIIRVTAKSIHDPRRMLLLALLSSLLVPFLLPKMLERYYFLADVLAVAVALSMRTPTAILVALCVQLASLLSLLTYMYFYVWPYPTLAGACFSAAALYGTWSMINDDATFLPTGESPAPAISG
jgi:Gpi18-like mannosyltransferase